MMVKGGHDGVDCGDGDGGGRGCDGGRNDGGDRGGDVCCWCWWLRYLVYSDLQYKLFRIFSW